MMGAVLDTVDGGGPKGIMATLLDNDYKEEGRGGGDNAGMDKVLR
jgi:hypothetical protein